MAVRGVRYSPQTSGTDLAAVLAKALLGDPKNDIAIANLQNSLLTGKVSRDVALRSLQDRLANSEVSRANSNATTRNTLMTGETQRALHAIQTAYMTGKISREEAEEARKAMGFKINEDGGKALSEVFLANEANSQSAPTTTTSNTANPPTVTGARAPSSPAATPGVATVAAPAPGGARAVPMDPDRALRPVARGPIALDPDRMYRDYELPIEVDPEPEIPAITPAEARIDPSEYLYEANPALHPSLGDPTFDSDAPMPGVTLPQERVLADLDPDIYGATSSEPPVPVVQVNDVMTYDPTLAALTSPGATPPVPATDTVPLPPTVPDGSGEDDSPPLMMTGIKPRHLAYGSDAAPDPFVPAGPPRMQALSEPPPSPPDIPLPLPTALEAFRTSLGNAIGMPGGVPPSGSGRPGTGSIPITDVPPPAPPFRELLSASLGMPGGAPPSGGSRPGTIPGAVPPAPAPPPPSLSSALSAALGMPGGRPPSGGGRPGTITTNNPSAGPPVDPDRMGRPAFPLPPVDPDRMIRYPASEDQPVVDDEIAALPVGGSSPIPVPAVPPAEPIQTAAPADWLSQLLANNAPPPELEIPDGGIVSPNAHLLRPPAVAPSAAVTEDAVPQPDDGLASPNAHLLRPPVGQYATPAVPVPTEAPPPAVLAAPDVDPQAFPVPPAVAAVPVPAEVPPAVRTTEPIVDDGENPTVVADPLDVETTGGVAPKVPAWQSRPAPAPMAALSGDGLPTDAAPGPVALPTPNAAATTSAATGGAGDTGAPPVPASSAPPGPAPATDHGDGTVSIRMTKAQADAIGRMAAHTNDPGGQAAKLAGLTGLIYGKGTMTPEQKNATLLAGGTAPARSGVLGTDEDIRYSLATKAVDLDDGVQEVDHRKYQISRDPKTGAKTMSLIPGQPEAQKGGPFNDATATGNMLNLIDKFNNTMSEDDRQKPANRAAYNAAMEQIYGDKITTAADGTIVIMKNPIPVGTRRPDEVGGRPLTTYDAAGNLASGAPAATAATPPPATAAPPPAAATGSVARQDKNGRYIVKEGDREVKNYGGWSAPGIPEKAPTIVPTSGGGQVTRVAPAPSGEVKAELRKQFDYSKSTIPSAEYLLTRKPGSGPSAMTRALKDLSDFTPVGKDFITRNTTTAAEREYFRHVTEFVAAVTHKNSGADVTKSDLKQYSELFDLPSNPSDQDIASMQDRVIRSLKNARESYTGQMPEDQLKDFDRALSEFNIDLDRDYGSRSYSRGDTPPAATKARRTDDELKKQYGVK